MNYAMKTTSFLQNLAREERKEESFCADQTLELLTACKVQSLMFLATSNAFLILCQIPSSVQISFTWPTFLLFFFFSLIFEWLSSSLRTCSFVSFFQQSRFYISSFVKKTKPLNNCFISVVNDDSIKLMWSFLGDSWTKQ